MSGGLLADRAVLRISGEDARDFLQGLITKDIRKITAEKPVFAALLSPQGRFLFDFFIVEYEGGFLLDMDKARLPDLVKRLTMYRLRSKVEITPLPDMQVGACWGDAPKGAGEISLTDPRLPELGWRIIGKNPKIAVADDYDLHRISLGVPEGSKDLAYDRSIPLEYGYDELHGVDFDKGCYVGQEVTARSKHRATLRKFIHCVQAEQPLPARGTSVYAGEREVGTLLSAAGTKGLAHLRVEEVGRASRENTLLKAGDITLKVALPTWCKTSFST